MAAFNIGNTKEVSIGRLAQVVKEMTGSCSEIVYIPYDEAYEEGFEDMPRRVPEISKVSNLIGYRPAKDLPSILSEGIASLQPAEVAASVP